MKLLLAVSVIALVCSAALADSERQCDYCKAKLELGIVLDSSSSISRDDFTKGQRFLQEYLKNFYINPDAVRVSIITYGMGVHPEDSFNLTTYNTGSEVEEAIGLIPHRATVYTATGEGIRFMREEQLASRLTRPGVARVSLVITDGNSQETKITANEAQRARDEGIEMFALGVGPSVDEQELLNIAGSDERVDRVVSYDKLKTITDWLVKLTCVGERL